MSAVRSFTTLLFLLSYILYRFGANARAQLSTEELENESAEEIANRTYVEEQTELQRSIFSKYNKRKRPVKNSSEPLDVAIHVYLMHLSVNQLEQTITLNGHIYMTWKDEYAVWEPSEHNGVRTTMVKQWEIWTPELRVTNSVSGVGQYFEISKRSHVIIQSNGKAWSRVEVYPTFSIKVGCSFDFSSYPYDRQRCALGIFTTYRMSDVQLSIYYNIQPTVLLGWGAQSDKKHISDWRLEKVSTNLSYYSNGKYSSVRPVDPEQLDVSWSILYTWLYLKRNAFCFGLGVLLPSMIAYMFVIFSFLLPSPESSIYILIANLFLLGVFLEDLITMLPPTIGRAPRIVYFTGLNLVLTTIAIGIQFWLRYILKAPGNASGWALHVIRVRNMLTPQRWKAESIKAVDGDEEQFTTEEGIAWRSVADSARLLATLLFLLIFFLSFIALFI
ncbi:Acetylcholine receptor-like protein cup-4 [Toxocara canis]|uniref:Acetylcholine receptor-like protein cup-4 n=1 Tax=Toxocara canis TaxID=6265 RepID=A0A0B2VC10_TOXCA|nr:Acetylcholine receptor-like protein cup-4 [Toxocara canis]